ncbi:MAG: rod shape-determining protein RodA [Candidatus Pacebacteria bacterium]|nr:rod shape-determining protein RodA [Candidatus Paceibacterota bacterium]
MEKVLDHIKRLDWVIVLVASVLSLIGILSIYGFNESNLVVAQKQIFFLCLGIILMVAISFFDWRVLKESSALILALYSIGIILLLGLFVFAPAVRDVRRWYLIGPFSFDPVEFIKIVLIILLAKYFSSRHIEMYKIRHIIFSGIYIAIPSAITFFQPDLGSSIILVFLWVGVLILSGIKIKHFVILTLIGSLLFLGGWSFLLKDYQKSRIIGFLEPTADVQGVGWNLEQAKIAIGSGGLWGTGIGEGSQTRYGFLPEAKTDFIFASIAEEMGFVGVSVLFILFFILIWRILKIIFSSTDNFSRIVCSGFLIIIISQAFVNIGMNQGILPIVGIPLPLVSYGGSSLIFTFIGLGLIQSIHSKG